MYFSNELLQSVLLLGFLQGCISSILLWRSNKTYAPSRLMAVLLFLVSLACLNSYFFHAVWFQHSVLLCVLHAFIPLVIVMPIGPLLYFYVRKESRPNRWHFSPLLIDLVPYITALIYIAGHAFHIFTKGSVAWADFIDNYNTLADLPRWLSLSIYLVLAWRIAPNQHLWIKTLLVGFSIFQTIWLLFLVPYLWPAFNIRLLQTVGWYPVMVPLVILIYWAGIKAWLFAREQPAKPKKLLTGNTIMQALPLLERAMTADLLYLDPKLQVEKVALHTGLPAKTISATLNQHLGQSFNRWVNTYRIEAFKKRLNDGSEALLTLEGIARECGFNSSTSFQRIFKQLTGTVPTEYRDRLNTVKVHPDLDLGIAERPAKI